MVIILAFSAGDCGFDTCTDQT